MIAWGKVIIQQAERPSHARIMRKKFVIKEWISIEHDIAGRKGVMFSGSLQQKVGFHFIRISDETTHGRRR